MALAEGEGEGVTEPVVAVMARARAVDNPGLRLRTLKPIRPP